MLFGAVLLAGGSIRASRRLHNALVSHVLRAPMAFFDATPLGRLTNRCALDVDTIDYQIPKSVDIWLKCFFILLTTAFIISYGMPWFPVTLIPISVFYGFVQVGRMDDLTKLAPWADKRLTLIG